MEICSPFGVQQITIDPETGEPVEPTAQGADCDWCQSFGVATDVASRADIAWTTFARDFQMRVQLASSPHHILRLAADYQSRAPPVL